MTVKNFMLLTTLMTTEECVFMKLFSQGSDACLYWRDTR